MTIQQASTSSQASSKMYLKFKEDSKIKFNGKLKAKIKVKVKVNIKVKAKLRGKVYGNVKVVIFPNISIARLKYVRILRHP